MKTFLVTLLSALSLLAQAPVERPQPVGPTYSYQELQLFPTYDRESYLAKFGKQAPEFDPARSAKAWFDSTKSCAGSAPAASYKVLDLAAVQIVPLSLSACDAATVNLPGKFNYPQRVIEPSKAWVVGNGVKLYAVDALYLSTREEAEAVRAEIGDNTLSIADGSLAGFFSTYYEPDEPRRQWLVGDMNVGWTLAKQKYAEGIGRTGRWVKDGPTTYHFELNPLPLQPRDPKWVPVPVRDLRPDEKLTFGGLMGGVYVQRGSAQQPSEPGGGFSAADRASLLEILSILKGVVGNK